MRKVLRPLDVGDVGRRRTDLQSLRDHRLVQGDPEGRARSPPEGLVDDIGRVTGQMTRRKGPSIWPRGHAMVAMSDATSFCKFGGIDGPLTQAETGSLQNYAHQAPARTVAGASSYPDTIMQRPERFSSAAVSISSAA